MVRVINISLALLAGLILYCSLSAQIESNTVIIDCHHTRETALGDTVKVPRSILSQQSVVSVKYYSFDNKIHRGQIVVAKSVVNDIKALFDFIVMIKYPIAKVIPVGFYGNSDSLSMLDNNTSGFNYRCVSSTKILSKHAYGRAIDINPFHNPCIDKKGIQPTGSKYDPDEPGTLSDTSSIVQFMKKRGWTWGGDWKSKKDYQHFEKK